MRKIIVLGKEFRVALFWFLKTLKFRFRGRFFKAYHLTRVAFLKHFFLSSSLDTGDLICAACFFALIEFFLSRRPVSENINRLCSKKPGMC